MRLRSLEIENLPDTSGQDMDGKVRGISRGHFSVVVKGSTLISNGAWFDTHWMQSLWRYVTRYSCITVKRYVTRYSVYERYITRYRPVT